MKYGIHRVVEPSNVLPVSAWYLNNSRNIYNDELLINIKSLHIETTNFKQLCVECNNDEEKIKERIVDIIFKRGKFHNPVTDTGGVVFGVVEKIGSQYENEKELFIGDEILCNTSVAAIPIFISKITKIDFVLGQIEAEGYAILFNNCPIVKKPQDVPIYLMLLAFNESGSLYSISTHARNKKSFLVVGSNIITSIFYGYIIRKTAGESAKIVCIIDGSREHGQMDSGMEELFSQVFNEIHYMNILKPIECIEKINCKDLFELSVNCADIPGAETINVLSTASKGMVYFTNLINNYNIALYITEAISREIEIKCADGYVENYEAFNIQIVREISEYLRGDITRPAGKEENKFRSQEETNEIYHHKKNMIDDFVCESRVMSLVVDEVLSVSKYDCSVLIIGDTGVGKEKIAALIHKTSARKLQPLVKINCAAITEGLLESELFGYEKGAFTGAKLTGKKGFFELADNGIIFLDEIGELSLELQAKLLRVIQEGEFYKIGGIRPIKTNVRIISATNKNLEKMIEEKKFRRDLYYRLNVFPIRVPSLKERKSEIPILIQYFTDKYNKKFGMKKTVSVEAIEYLKECDWPGNIRELENMIQRLLINSKTNEVEAFTAIKEMNSEIFNRIEIEEANSEDKKGVLCLDRILENYEKQIIKLAAAKYGSSRSTANALGISQSQYIRKKNKYEIIDKQIHP